MKKEGIDGLIQDYTEYYKKVHNKSLKKAIGRFILRLKQMKWAKEYDNKIRRL